ncbi:hypothetical protein [Comamonas odontotermitis]|uniref:hypothetical protein n=1 Tax=Comamonas odontotermitis TaxID=379895 RepID=UPI001CC60E29|nr:hypothetical protein [Comamonas odontotermitis]UBB18212.1 hypothetical protein LAD35_06135 [Comamonas odontotermitis]
MFLIFVQIAEDVLKKTRPFAIGKVHAFFMTVSLIVAKLSPFFWGYYATPTSCGSNGNIADIALSNHTCR